MTDLLFLLFVSVGSITACRQGARIGSTYGIWGAVVGGILGLIAGPVVAVVAVLLLAFVWAPFERLGRWWRPYPPLCESGNCIGHAAYALCEISEDVVKAVKGLSWLGHRCGCGNLYAGGYDYALRNRWVRVLPDGTIRPYLRHRAFGTWQPDDAVAIARDTSKVERRRAAIELPGWLIPCLTSALCGGMALLVIWQESEPAPHALASWFIAACAAVGFFAGFVAWRLGK